MKSTSLNSIKVAIPSLPDTCAMSTTAGQRGLNMAANWVANGLLCSGSIGCESILFIWRSLWTCFVLPVFTADLAVSATGATGGYAKNLVKFLVTEHRRSRAIACDENSHYSGTGSQR